MVATLKVSPLAKLLRITACDRPSAGPGTDVLLYPVQIRLVGLQRHDLPAWVQYLMGDQETKLQEVFLEKFVFLLCAHANRDPRCGQCGPGLRSSLQAHLSKAGLGDQAEVWASSHLGGHRFAGVMVCYPSGNWYGRVADEDLPSLVAAEIHGHAPVSALWRVQMAMLIKEQITQGARLNSPDQER